MQPTHSSNEELDTRPGESLDATLQREVEEAIGQMSLLDVGDAGEPPATSGEETLHRGRVISVQKDEILVELGPKTTGLLQAKQFAEEPLPEVGSVIEVTITGFDDREQLVLLSRQGAVTVATWQSLEVGQTVEGRVTGHNKGGLELDINGIRGFMPLSQIDVYRVDAPEEYLDQRLRCEVLELKQRERSAVVSRRAVLAREATEARERVFSSLADGQTVDGTVKTIMPYGAFVDIGGVDGLLHVRDMGYGRVEDPRSVVQEGQKLQVMVLKVDSETRRIALGLKQILPDPWDGAESKWPPDEIVTGKITRLMDFGAFVELTPGVEGLIPVSEMSYERRISHPREVLEAGQEVRARVLNVDPGRRRISLSVKRVGEDPWVGASVRWPAESVADGTVKKVTAFGAFVELTPGVEGLVHISELANSHVRDVTEVLREGQAVQAKVLSVDEDRRRIALSVKQLATMPDYTGPVSTEPMIDRPRRKRPLRGGLDR